MITLPAALGIALWLVLSLWAVQIISYIFDLSGDYFWLAVVIGTGAAYLGWQQIQPRQG